LSQNRPFFCENIYKLSRRAFFAEKSIPFHELKLEPAAAMKLKQ
jgi:hypothetical protein